MIVRADLHEDAEYRKRMVTDGLEAGFCAFMLREGDERYAELGRMDVIYTRNGVPKDKDIVYANVTTPEEQDAVLALAGTKKAVIAETGEWRIIPLENMIAKFRGSGTEVYAVAHNAEDAETFLKTMENGTDGVVIAVDDPSEISSTAMTTPSTTIPPRSRRSVR